MIAKNNISRYIVCFNISLAVSFILWVWLVYSSSKYAALLLIISAVIDLLFILVINSKDALISMAIWMFAFLLAPNIILTQKQLIWTGLEYNELTGWYPLKNMKNINLNFNTHGQYAVSTDEYGHRNQVPYRKNLEYVVQGDSNVFGYGLKYEDTLCYKLNEIIGQKFYNFGVPGFDVNQYYFQYKYFSGKFIIKNRIVILNIGNDFTLSAYKTAYLIKRPYLEVKNGVVLEVLNNTNTIKKQAYGYRFIDKYKEYDNLVEFLDAGRGWGYGCPQWFNQVPVILFVKEKLSPAIFKIFSHFYSKKKIEIANALSPYYPEWLLLKIESWPQPYKDYTKDFEKIISCIKKQNENIIICLLPMKSQVINDDFRLAVKDLLNKGYEEDSIDRYSFNKYFSDICLKNKIKLVDLTPVLSDYYLPHELYQSDNNHLSGKGMDVCATAIARMLF